jgi:hypothetical protein
MARKINGWVGRILRVDLSSGRIWSEDTMNYAKGYHRRKGNTDFKILDDQTRGSKV